MQPKPKEWYSREEDAQIRKAKRNGLTILELAVLINRTENSVRERARRLGIGWSNEAGTSGLVLDDRITDFSAERINEARQRESDKRFVRELAKAFLRGDHLPAGQPKPLRLMG